MDQDDGEDRAGENDELEAEEFSRYASGAEKKEEAAQFESRAFVCYV